MQDLHSLYNPLSRTSQELQCQRVSICTRQLLHVYDRLLFCTCSSYSMAMDEYLTRRSDENSWCFSRAIVRNVSRPSIRSQWITGSGSWMSGKAVLGWWRRMTKNTCDNSNTCLQVRIALWLCTNYVIPRTTWYTVCSCNNINSISISAPVENHTCKNHQRSTPTKTKFIPAQTLIENHIQKTSRFVHVYLQEHY